MNPISFEICDFNQPAHQKALNNLLNSYMSDPMGDCQPHDEQQQRQLIEGLSNHPTAMVLFVLYQGLYAGMTTCFVNYSTFKLKPYLYIHDVFVLDEFRGKHLGRALLEKLVALARQQNYCKLTLEVRSDNPVAQSLYHQIGFDECQPVMHYWEKHL
ncbi:MAG: GNAT family N-acetyltransferase [Bacteroidota bacterium]|nr:GNAT family N-acetyltransferase [Bacteroidota bacterium]